MKRFSSLIVATTLCLFSLPLKAQKLAPGYYAPLELFLAFEQNEIINFKGDRSSSFFFGTQAPPKDWHHLCFDTDEVMGACIEKAYEKFGEPKHEVVVAVIDSGVDLNHNDLQGKAWINRDEIPNNGIDDDGNGYIDDIFGWNFLGSSMVSAKVSISLNSDSQKITPTAEEFHLLYETLSLTRVVKNLMKKEELNEEQKNTLKEFKRVSVSQTALGKRNIQELKQKIQLYEESQAVLKLAGLESITLETLEKFEPKNEKESLAQKRMTLMLLQKVQLHDLKNRFFYYNALANYAYNLNNDERARIVGDDPDNTSERSYGNNDVLGHYSYHGTHVAGIIASKRDKTSSVKGIASNAKIMALKVVPVGDERDKDIANAIYYAVDNGAKIINMSFGKSYSRHRNIVEEAILYAQKHDVLLVAAAGNESENVDLTPFYPSSIFMDNSRAKNYLTIGANTHRNDFGLAASFSNFGKNRVDLFAPGQNISSLYPDNNYQEASGTSMAAPVVAGIAAVILGHHPHLGAAELAQLLQTSSTDLSDQEIRKFGVGSAKFGELSRSGGVVNLFKALQKL